MVKIKITKKTLGVSLGFLTLMVLVFAYTSPIPNPGHGGDTVWVDTTKGVAGGEMDLQSMINSGGLEGTIEIIEGSWSMPSTPTQAGNQVICPSGKKILGCSGGVNDQSTDCIFSIRPVKDSVTGEEGCRIQWGECGHVGTNKMAYVYAYCI